MENKLLNILQELLLIPSTAEGMWDAIIGGIRNMRRIQNRPLDGVAGVAATIGTNALALLVCTRTGPHRDHHLLPPLQLLFQAIDLLHVNEFSNLSFTISKLIVIDLLIFQEFYPCCHLQVCFGVFDIPLFL